MTVQNFKKVALVTGATGFVGNRLAERLINDGWSIRLLVRDPNKLSPILRSIKDILVGDLNDVEVIARAVSNIGVVFHCAANVNTWDSWDNYYRSNVLGVKNLMEAIADNNGLLRLVHLSTVDVYGFPIYPCDEFSLTMGNGFSYGETKLLGEALVKEYADKIGLSYTIIRPTNVIGPRSQFIERIGAELQSGLMLTVDNGRSNAGFVYIDNLVDYLIWAASAKEANCECYNVRDNYNINWAVFLSKFRTTIKGKGIVVNLPFPIADAIAWVFETFYKLFHLSAEPLLHRLLVRFFGRTCGHSAKKIQTDSNYVPKIGFDEAMEHSISWFMEKASKK